MGGRDVPPETPFWGPGEIPFGLCVLCVCCVSTLQMYAHMHKPFFHPPYRSRNQALSLVFLHTLYELFALGFARNGMAPLLFDARFLPCPALPITTNPTFHKARSEQTTSRQGASSIQWGKDPFPSLFRLGPYLLGGSCACILLVLYFGRTY